MHSPDTRLITRALEAVGELLEDEGAQAAIVVVGGTALNLLGVVERATFDVDVIARAEGLATGTLLLRPASPLPEALSRAATRVARDFGLPPSWMNAEVSAQWSQGLPPITLEETTWRTFGGLTIGLVGRRPMVALKLFAAVDRGRQSVHVQDLLALTPTDEDLDQAADWVKGQDASLDFGGMVEEVIRHVRESR
jgi:hypothetical protein